MMLFGSAAWLQGREPHGEMLDQGDPNGNGPSGFRYFDRTHV